MVALEWMDVEPLIGCKVSDYIIQHKRVEDPSEAEVYTGRKINKTLMRTSFVMLYNQISFVPHLTYFTLFAHKRPRTKWRVHN